MKILRLLQPALQHRHLPIWVALLAVLLSLPSITAGWELDDYMHRALLLMPREDLPPGMGRLDLFKFSTGDPEVVAAHRDNGFAPWWTPDDLKLAFWRPLSGAAHWVQYHLWPHTPWPMHAVSLAWLGLLTWLAALFFRRFLPTPWIAGLAALLYAIQPGHATTAGWVANQNALMSMTFGLIAILTHDRWRVNRWWPGAWISPLALLASVLSAEAGIATGAYLLAYAMLADPMKMHPRGLLFILPHFCVGLVWAALYHAGGFGVSGSGFYIDPVGEPREFLSAVLERMPMLLAATWGLAPVSFFAVFSDAGWRVVVILCTLFAGLLTLLILPHLRRRAGMQFMAMGSMMSLLPVCATMPGERNLLFAGLGAIGPLAQWIGDLHRRRQDLAEQHGTDESLKAFAPLNVWQRFGGRVAALLLLLHLVLGPLLALANSRTYTNFEKITERGYDGILQEPEVVDQTTIFINPPVAFMNTVFLSYRMATGEPVPERFRILATGIYPLALTRIDERTLSVRAGGGGFLQPRGRWNVPGQPRDPIVNVHHMSQMMDRVFRGPGHPFVRGETTHLEGMTAIVQEPAEGDGVNEVHFRFAEVLEHPRYRWFIWEDEGYIEVDPPRIGATRELPPVDFFALLQP